MGRVAVVTDDSALGSVVPLGEVVFDRPPVVEVALAIHFTEDKPRTTGQIGALWSRLLQDRYPLSQDQQLVPPQLEDFSQSPERAVPAFASLFIGSPTGSRSWFLTKDQTSLVQIQKDRIVLNWRRLESDTYPQYPALRQELVRLLGLLEASGSLFNFWPLTPTQVEVTYINEVAPSLKGRPLLSAAKFDWPDWFGTPGPLQFQQVFTSSSIDECPSRLYVTVGVGNTGQPQLELTCKSLVQAGQIDQALALLEDAHHKIVHGFKTIISAEMFGEWGGR